MGAPGHRSHRRRLTTTPTSPAGPPLHPRSIASQRRGLRGSWLRRQSHRQGAKAPRPPSPARPPPTTPTVSRCKECLLGPRHPAHPLLCLSHRERSRRSCDAGEGLPANPIIGNAARRRPQQDRSPPPSHVEWGGCANRATAPTAVAGTSLSHLARRLARPRGTPSAASRCKGWLREPLCRTEPSPPARPHAPPVPPPPTSTVPGCMGLLRGSRHRAQPARWPDHAAPQRCPVRHRCLTLRGIAAPPTLSRQVGQSARPPRITSAGSAITTVSRCMEWLREPCCRGKPALRSDLPAPPTPAGPKTAVSGCMGSLRASPHCTKPALRFPLHLRCRWHPAPLSRVVWGRCARRAVVPGCRPPPPQPALDSPSPSPGAPPPRRYPQRPPRGNPSGGHRSGAQAHPSARRTACRRPTHQCGHPAGSPGPRGAWPRCARAHCGQKPPPVKPQGRCGKSQV
jgi:hypothetical protein